MEAKESFTLSELRNMPLIKRSVYRHPVLLTQHGAPEFALMTIAQYEEIQSKLKQLEKLQNKAN